METCHDSWRLANGQRLLLNNICHVVAIFLREVSPLTIIIAMVLDAVFGDPKNVTHPVEVIGKIILFWEKFLYGEGNQRLNGFIFCLAVLFTVELMIFIILKLALLLYPPLYLMIEIFLLYSALSCRSLKDEAQPIAAALVRGDITGARSRLSGIVGRDTAVLSESGVVRATVETVAESYIDGVVAVLFYMVLGLFCGYAVPFAWFFKTVSTMDSMVGYDDERYRDYGFAAARLDDLLNFIPARIGAVLTVAAACFSDYDYKNAWQVFIRDRLKHKSPNSAHGESVFAGLLGITLGGGAYYCGEYESRPVLGDDFREPEPVDIWRACDILDRSYMLCALLVLIIVHVCRL